MSLVSHADSHRFAEQYRLCRVRAPVQTCDVAGLRDIARKLVQLAGERDLARIRTRVRRKASPVVEYNVYRGTQSGGPYQRLNLSPQPDNSYTDGTVQSGLTYFYVATAVGTTWSRAGIPMRPRPQFADLLIKTNCAGWKVVLSCSERVRGENSNQSNTSALRNGTPRLSFSDTMGGSRSRQSIFKSESFHASVRSDAAS